MGMSLLMHLAVYKMFVGYHQRRKKKAFIISNRLLLAYTPTSVMTCVSLYNNIVRNYLFLRSRLFLSAKCCRPRT